MQFRLWPMIKNRRKEGLTRLIVIPLILLLIVLNSPLFSSFNLRSPEAIPLPTFPTVFPTIMPTFTLFPHYWVFVTPSNITIDQGAQIQTVVTVGSYFGYNKTVSLYSTVPSGITITFAVTKITPPTNSNQSTTAFMSVAKTVPAGTYTAFINATDGTSKGAVKLLIKVNAITTTTSTTTITTTTTTTTTTSSTTTTPTTTTSTSTTSTSTTTTPTTTSSTTSTTTTTTTTSSGGSDMTMIIVLAIIIIIIVAVVAFFLLRKKPPPPTETPKRYCMHCGTGMTGEALSCPKCGKQPAGGPDTKTCPNCGAVINIVASFCPKCGAAQSKENDKGGTTSG